MPYMYTAPWKRENVRRNDTHKGRILLNPHNFLHACGQMSGIKRHHTFRKGKEMEMWLHDRSCWVRVKLGDPVKPGQHGEYMISFPSHDYANRAFPFFDDMMNAEEDGGWRYAWLPSVPLWLTVPTRPGAHQVSGIYSCRTVHLGFALWLRHPELNSSIDRVVFE